MALMSSPFGANSTKFYDETYTHRIYSVLGDVRKFEPMTPEPCDDTTGDPTRLTITVTEAGVGGDTLVTNSVTAGGWLKVVTDNAEYDGANAQAKGETFKLEASKPLYFRGKVSIDNATESDLLIGLCETKTDLLKTGTAHGVNTSVEGAFFLKVDGATTIFGKTYEGGTETNSVQASAAMTTSAITYEMVWDGSQLSFFVDGVNIGTVTANLPNGDLTPSFNIRAGSAAARTAEVSMWCYQAGS